MSAARLSEPSPVSLLQILREWGRIGCVGFGGPPAHIALFRELCVDQRRWMTHDDFEDAIAATNLLPGPGSTQLSIFCAWRLRGFAGALVGGLSFIVPGLVLILGLSALFLQSAPPGWIRGAGAGAGAAVAAVAVHAALKLVPGSWQRAKGAQRQRWLLYALLGATAAALVGPWLVLVLLAAGAIEMTLHRRSEANTSTLAALFPVAATASSGGILALVWVAFKVGALSYGGGFVIVPLMQGDAVDHYHWMTNGQFLNAVALGQVTPGPVVHTVAAVGYAAGGLGGALLAAAVGFAPSFSFILLGGRRFDRLRQNPNARAFLDGAGPAAIGAILGVSIPLALALSEGWQFAILAGSALLLFALRRGVVTTLVAAGTIGAVIAALASGQRAPTEQAMLRANSCGARARMTQADPATRR